MDPFRRGSRQALCMLIACWLMFTICGNTQQRCRRAQREKGSGRNEDARPGTTRLREGKFSAPQVPMHGGQGQAAKFTEFLWRQVLPAFDGRIRFPLLHGQWVT